MCSAKSRCSVGLVAKERQTAPVAHRHGQPGVDERLPVVGVEDDVPHGPLALDVGDPPVEPDAVAQLPLVLGERDARRPDEPAVAGQEHGGMGALPAELVDHVGRRSPVGVDQAALDPHAGAVVASPFPAQVAVGEGLQPGVDRAFQAGALGGLRQAWAGRRGV